ncbi:MAG: hypothetical protein ISR69_04490, partial [Gammaproteobacteria bacterium]|nr:hypothetical protein [Gammaproteobacteria bacterium]
MQQALKQQSLDVFDIGVITSSELKLFQNKSKQKSISVSSFKGFQHFD